MVPHFKWEMAWQQHCAARTACRLRCCLPLRFVMHETSCHMQHGAKPLSRCWGAVVEVVRRSRPVQRVKHGTAAVESTVLRVSFRPANDG